jgi:hypothetical protein
VNVNDITVSVLPVLVKLFNDNGTIREEAPNVLANLVTGSEELQKAACDASAITKLTSFLQEEGVSDIMKENVLNALAELCLNREEGRKLIVESKILSVIIAATSDENERVRQASILCLKGLSRANKQLRSSLIEAGVASQLFNLLNDSSLFIQSQACAVISNIVLDFVPMKQYIIEKNVLERLVSYTNSMDSTLRLHSVFALKNLAFFADSTTRETVLKQLTCEDIFRLLNDEETEVQATTLNLIRNLIHGEVTPALSQLIIGDNGQKLLFTIDDKLSNNLYNKTDNTTTTSLITESVSVLCNLAAISSAKELIVTPTIMKHLMECLKHSEKEIRSTAIWTLINVSWKENHPNYDKCIKELNTWHVVQVLEELLKNDPEMDVKDRAKQCLEQLTGKYKHQRIVVTAADDDDDDEEEEEDEESDDEDVEMRNRDETLIASSFLSMHDEL